MKNILFIVVFSIISSNAYSADCYGIPNVVKMGEYGAQESYVIMRMDGKDYRLGRFDEEATKYRISLAQTALVSDKQIKLRFWDTESCDIASTNRQVPNSMQLIK